SLCSARAASSFHVTSHGVEVQSSVPFSETFAPEGSLSTRSCRMSGTLGAGLPLAEAFGAEDATAATFGLALAGDSAVDADGGVDADGPSVELAGLFDERTTTRPMPSATAMATPPHTYVRPLLAACTAAMSVSAGGAAAEPSVSLIDGEAKIG